MISYIAQNDNKYNSNIRVTTSNNNRFNVGYIQLVVPNILQFTTGAKYIRKHLAVILIGNIKH